MMTCFGHCGPSSGHKITGKTICSVSTQPQEAKLVLVKSPQDTKTYTTRSIRNNAVLTLHYKGHRRYLKVQEYRTYRHNLMPTDSHTLRNNGTYYGRHPLRQTPRPTHEDHLRPHLHTPAHRYATHGAYPQQAGKTQPACTPHDWTYGLLKFFYTTKHTTLLAAQKDQPPPPPHCLTHPWGFHRRTQQRIVHL